MSDSATKLLTDAIKMIARAIVVAALIRSGGFSYDCSKAIRQIEGQE